MFRTRFSDFNGDSKTDVLWRNTNTGDVSAWLINGNTVSSYPVYANVPPNSGWDIKGFGDFNGDSKTDVLWRNTNTGDVSAWLINGNTVSSYPVYANVPPNSGWDIKGFGDFNGDSKTDVLWRNTNTGDVSAWLMNGNTVSSYPVYANVPLDSGWDIKGFGDFNGDSKTDVLWRNTNTGDVSAWLMNGNTVSSYPVYANVPLDSGWDIKGFGDFNGDSKTDVLWRNTNTGDVSAWLINGDTVSNYAVYANVPLDSGWDIKGFGDFNGDSKTDVLWRNTNTGDVSAWLINGDTVRNYVVYANVPLDSGWDIKGFGDFNGDSKTDVLWRNTNTGDVSAWLINGDTVSNYAVYANVPLDSGWTPVFLA